MGQSWANLGGASLREELLELVAGLAPFGREARRKRWAPMVATGTVACARCGITIAADEPWDLGHDEHDRSRPTRPEHRACNRATAGRRQLRIEASGPFSRDW